AAGGRHAPVACRGGREGAIAADSGAVRPVRQIGRTAAGGGVTLPPTSRQAIIEEAGRPRSRTLAQEGKGRRSPWCKESSPACRPPWSEAIGLGCGRRDGKSGCCR